MVGFKGAGLKEVISIESWYLWWIQRERMHGKSVPTNKCKMLILAMAANSAKVTGGSYTPNIEAK
jgi:hypothetical protein